MVVKDMAAIIALEAYNKGQKSIAGGIRARSPQQDRGNGSAARRSRSRSCRPRASSKDKDKGSNKTNDSVQQPRPA